MWLSGSWLPDCCEAEVCISHIGPPSGTDMDLFIAGIMPDSPHRLLINTRWISITQTYRKHVLVHVFVDCWSSITGASADSSSRVMYGWVFTSVWIYLWCIYVTALTQLPADMLELHLGVCVVAFWWINFSLCLCNRSEFLVTCSCASSYLRELWVSGYSHAWKCICLYKTSLANGPYVGISTLGIIVWMFAYSYIYACISIG